MTQTNTKETKSSLKKKKSKKTTSNDQEIKAYIYQQLNELESLIPKGSTVSIEVNEVVENQSQSENGTIATRMSVKTPVGELLADEMNEDIFKSITEATNSLAHQLTLLKTSFETQLNRDSLVDFYSQNTYMH